MKGASVTLFIIILAALLAPHITFAGTTVSIELNATVGSGFRIEFYQPDGTHILYSDTIPFSSIDPTETFALPDGRVPGDNKSDVGIYCLSNDPATWYLKMSITGGNIPDGKLKYYLSQPTLWDGTQSIVTDGRIFPDPPAWTPIPQGRDLTIYSSGSIDTINLPNGTLATLNFQLDPSGLNAGVSYSAVITYTMTTST